MPLHALLVCPCRDDLKATNRVACQGAPNEVNHSPARACHHNILDRAGRAMLAAVHATGAQADGRKQVSTLLLSLP